MYHNKLMLYFSYSIPDGSYTYGLFPSLLKSDMHMQLPRGLSQIYTDYY